jgi:hypothetical protein
MLKKIILAVIFLNNISIIIAQQQFTDISFSNYPESAAEGKMDNNTIRGLKIGSVCLLYLGLSIGMREGFYYNNPSDNWMGSVNSFITLAGLGAGGGFLLGITKKTGWDTILHGILFGGIGFLAGSIAHFAAPEIRTAFKENRILYYAAPAVIGGIGISGLTFIIAGLFNRD